MPFFGTGSIPSKSYPQFNHKLRITPQNIIQTAEFRMNRQFFKLIYFLFLSNPAGSICLGRDLLIQSTVAELLQNARRGVRRISQWASLWGRDSSHGIAVQKPCQYCALLTGHIFPCVITLYISLLKAYTIVVLQVVYVVQLQPFAPPKGWS